MDELIGWLRAQLDKDAALAREIVESEAGAPEWEETSSGVLVTGPPTHDDAWEGTHPIGDSRLTRFMAHNDPARVLREVEAKRAIVDWHDAAWKNLDGHPDDLPGKGWLLAMVKVVKLLALPYADRPGYREEWRPA